MCILAAGAAAFLAPRAAAPVCGPALAAEEPLELRLQSGSVFHGRIGPSDAAGFTLKSVEGGEIRIAWKDLDERSWLAAKRTVTPTSDARALLDLGRYAAEKAFRTDAETLIALAVRGDPALASEAEALRPRITELRRADAAALFDRGTKMLAEQKHLHALGRFKEARELDPTNARAANGMGEAQYHLRRLRESRASMKEAIALDPGLKDAVLNLAWLDLTELDFAACLAGLDRVLALPVAEGRAGTREDLDAKAKAAGISKPEDAWAQLADQARIQADEMAPLLRGIVAGPGFAKEYRAVTEHYDLRTDVSQEYADRVAAEMEVIYAEYERRFGFSKTGETKQRGKDLRFPVLVFSTRDAYVDWFGRVLRNPQLGAMTGGVYVTLVKHLVFFRYDTMEDTRLVAWHEGFHQYLDYFVAGAPHWFNEGQAEYFGASAYDEPRRKVKPGQSNPWRIGGLQALQAAGRIPDAKWLMQADAQTFMRTRPDPRYGKEGRTTAGEHYVVAWALVHFCLEGDGGRWQKNFLGYFKALCDGLPHDEAFEKAWGRVQFDRFQVAFEAHCKWLVARAVAEKDKRPIPPMPK